MELQLPQLRWRAPRHAATRKPRTQSSIAVSGDGANWLLCNASPDILAQLRASRRAAAGARAARHRRSARVLLIDAQIDHTTGLYMLREHRQPLPTSGAPIRCARISNSGNPLFRLLGHYCGVDWHRIPIGGEVFVMPTLPGLALHGAAAAQQRAAVLAASRPAGAGRQHRARDHRSCEQPASAVLRARTRRDRTPHVSDAIAARRLRAGRRHLLDATTS